MNPYLKRTIMDILLFIAVVVSPWWLSCFILAGLTIYFQFYPEVLFFGFLFDTLYGHNQIGLFTATIFLALVMFVKTRIRT